jgi:transcriptional regulator with XRE-family HTH domain
MSPDSKVRGLAAAGALLYGPRWQAPLARAAGIAQSMLSMIAAGERPLTDDMRGRIAAALKAEAARLRMSADKLDRLRAEIEG